MTAIIYTPCGSAHEVDSNCQPRPRVCCKFEGDGEEGGGEEMLDDAGAVGGGGPSSVPRKERLSTCGSCYQLVLRFCISR